MKRVHKFAVGMAGVLALALALAAATAFAAAPDWAREPCGGPGGGAVGYGPIGMMFGAGGYGGTGPGGYDHMWGYGYNMFAGLDLTADQRKQIAQIEEETAKSRWQLTGTMREQGYRMRGVFGPGQPDGDAVRRVSESMKATRQAMFDLSLAERKRIDAVRTAKRREQLQRYWGGW